MLKLSDLKIAVIGLSLVKSFWFIKFYVKVFLIALNALIASIENMEKIINSIKIYNEYNYYLMSSNFLNLWKYKKLIKEYEVNILINLYLDKSS